MLNSISSILGSVLQPVGSVLLPVFQSLVGSEKCQQEDVRRDGNAVLVCEVALKGK
jgi:hypothetical protein